MPEMIHNGFLSPVTGYRIETDIDLSNVGMRMGDFVSSQLSGAVNISQRNKIVVEVFHKLLANKQTLVFCVDVAHAKNLAHSFLQAGISCSSLTGDLHTRERKSILSDFTNKKTQVLTNCMVLTEGFDEPSIDGIILARPTKSSVLYTQMIGRGTRLHPGKKNVTIIDIVDCTSKHHLITLPSLFGLTNHFDLKGKTTSDVEKAIQWVHKNRPWVRTDLATDIDDLRYRCKHINLFELELPEELKYCASLAWIAMGDQTFKLNVGKGTSVTCEYTILEIWESSLQSIDKELNGTIISTGEDLDFVIHETEGYVREKYQESLSLLNLATRWRQQPATEKQLKLITSKNIHPPEGLTKGQASHFISMLLNSN
ncbi:DEAD/DEAH box helicase [Fibrobacterota bacterium]